jgi:serine/threonine protein kinase
MAVSGYVAGSELAPGTTLAGYRIEGLIGRGGMGAVYRAVETGLGRKVALKVIAPELAENERFRERFLRESQIAASLDHPHVIPIYQAGEEGGLLYLAMRTVEGTDFAKLVAEEGALEPRRRSSSSPRSRKRSTPPTRKGSSTATSSPPTCSWTRQDTLTSPTSA